MDQEQTAVLVLSHVLDRGVVALFEDIKACCAEAYEVIYLCDNTKGIFNGRAADPNHFLFDLQALETLAYPSQSIAYGDARRRVNPYHKDFNFAPGSIALPILLFFRKHPHYEYYWVVEYDVRFSGRWDRLFSAFRNNPADLLGTTLTRRERIPEWYHWAGLDLLDLPIDQRDHIRGFFPVYRISNEALAQLDRFYRQGVTGHFECIGPTLLRHAGLIIEDIGGDGEFVRPENVNRFYRNNPTRGSLSPGTFVFRPVSGRPGKEPDKLWHPVKHSSAWRILLHKLTGLTRRVVRRVSRAMA